MFCNEILVGELLHISIGELCHHLEGKALEYESRLALVINKLLDNYLLKLHAQNENHPTLPFLETNCLSYRRLVLDHK